jgi:drug/metabolite transporter (DMT)-like permease
VVASGVALAVHFGTWVTALTLTSVASATALVCLQIAFVVGWQLLRGERFGRLVVVGLVLAFAGVLVVSGVDLTLSTRALVGDLLALAGGLAAAAYMVIGSRARQVVSTTTYTFVVYGTCALVLLACCLVAGQALWGYPLAQWALLLLVTVTSQLMGHSVFNHLLATTSPMLVSLALLLEVPGASLIAAAVLGQVPPLAAVAGLAVILAGTALVIVGNRAAGVEHPPPD